jgi:hypothetical protein
MSVYINQLIKFKTPPVNNDYPRKFISELKHYYLMRIKLLGIIKVKSIGSLNFLLFKNKKTVLIFKTEEDSKKNDSKAHV